MNPPEEVGHGDGHGVFDDQVRFNSALDAANITWTLSATPATHFNNNNNNNIIISTSTSWLGHTPNGLKVRLLPQELACRTNYCTRKLREKVYIWHNFRTKWKPHWKQESDDGIWFLREDWKKEQWKKKGLKWLAEINKMKPVEKEHLSRKFQKSAEQPM